MKCLTIMEPYATLIALGNKRIETRSWKTSFRGRIAIHASKNINKASKEDCLIAEYLTILQPDYIQLAKDKKTVYNFDFGKVVAYADLVDCVQMKVLTDEHAVLSNGLKVEGDELLFGNFEPGRYAWILENVEKVEAAGEVVKGRLGLWNLEV
ncbi:MULTISPECIES: ASCH domain-containing protein [unclassified Fusibacter]|uniref:ASCH domain-containing protein n=1 Tax=unclassified Fusibacter TaxID=2624464 RepID=UPI0010117B30|nr:MULTISPECIES: ASCH domain-containing protein [unclassified Fusibacter]MCK8060290.1 ASCH domain-containing protein [Fusibacter sp. A2]NPE20421.1 ASCH domain-containing protein [Fusibacter sp. A1]RXV63626.1 ASCH domain-containing protein [Fusibacter sp. A1]